MARTNSGLSKVAFVARFYKERGAYLRVAINKTVTTYESTNISKFKMVKSSGKKLKF